MYYYIDPTASDAPIAPPQKGEASATLTLAGILAAIWLIAGIAAFITSLICFGRSGTTAQHMIGLVLAILFGPFYWIYFASVGDYCRPTGAKGGASARARRS